MLSPTRQELVQNLAQYISLATGLTPDKIIRGYQNAPDPMNSFCSFNYVTSSPMGTPKYSYRLDELDDTKINMVISSQRSVQFDVRFHRDLATDLANNFEIFTKSPLAQEYFQTSFFIIENIVQVNLTTILQSRNYEEQALVETYLKINETKTFETNAVAEITINGTSDFGNDSFVNSVSDIPLEAP
jgi:hypothetical protein